MPGKSIGRTHEAAIKGRRACLGAFAALALPWAAPFDAAAQQVGRVYRIGVLSSAPPNPGSPFLKALNDGLRERGWRPGEDIVYERRTTHGTNKTLLELAAELVAAKVDVILPGNNAATDAAQRATSTISIVFVAASNPVGAGFVSSLAHPGGNITGLSGDAAFETFAKPLQFMKQMQPKLAHVALLRDPGGSIPDGDKAAGEGAAALHLALDIIDLRTAGEIDDAIAAAKKARVDGILFWPNGMTYFAQKQFAQRALQEGLAAGSFFAVFAEEGGLLTYGIDHFELWRRAATFIDKILKGAKPADLPVEQPTKFELVLNRKTASALGLAIPQLLLLQADRVIE